MNGRRYDLIGTVVGFISVLAGCSSSEMLYSWRPMQGNMVLSEGPVIAAAVELREGPSATTTRPDPGKAVVQSRPATQPAGVQAYSSPSTSVRTMSFLTVAATSAIASLSPTGAREASESAVSAASLRSIGPIGAPSLGAPQARTVNAIVGQPGLWRGYANSFGLVPSNNLFTRNVIRLTGPGGRCQDLVNAGFFSSISQCENYFRRR